MERYRDAIDRRSNARMAREEADGTVFFKGPVETLTQELKLVDGPWSSYSGSPEATATAETTTATD